MEITNSEELGRLQRKSANKLRKINKRPESLSKSQETPQDDPVTQDEKPHFTIQIQRNSIFNRAVRHKSKAKAGDTAEWSTTRLAGQYQGQLSLTFVPKGSP
jgi:neuronal guanine nucleotide exchange factor